MGVGGYLVVDGESECQRFATSLSGDAGWCACAHGDEEVFEFEAKGFAFGDVRLGEGEACGGVLTGCGRGGVGGVGCGRGGCRRGGRAYSGRWGERGWESSRGRGLEGGGDCGWVDADGEEFLAGEVEAEVLVRLEEAEFADLFGGDAAGGEVGDAAGVELNADVGDVGLGGEDGEADGADFANGGVGEGEDDVEVVDHEVEDDVDVEGAGGEDAEPVGLEEHGLMERGEGGGDGGVEAFQMADGEDAVVGLSEGDEVVGFGEGGGEGLLDEDIEVCKELFGDGGVVEGGDADGSCVEGEVGGEDVGDGGEGGDVVGGGEGGAPLGEGIDESGELDEMRVSELEFAIDAKVIAPEGTGADDGDAKRRHGYFWAAAPGSGDSTATRQRV